MKLMNNTYQKIGIGLALFVITVVIKYATGWVVTESSGGGTMNELA